jgi:hypothetical protein
MHYNKIIILILIKCLMKSIMKKKISNKILWSKVHILMKIKIHNKIYRLIIIMNRYKLKTYNNNLMSKIDSYLEMIRENHHLKNNI